MSNTPKKRPVKRPAADPRPLEVRKIPPVEEITFSDQMRVKAATGIDLLDPPMVGLQMAAVLWLVSRNDETPLTWDECKAYNLAHLEVDGDDADLPPGDEGAAADPTGGPATPSSGSPLPSTSD